MVHSIIRKTKIVCTIGPASASAATIEQMVLRGMNVARMNFSHGTWEDHAQNIQTVRAISTKLNVPVAILQDLPGPKLRVGIIQGGAITLREGDEFSLTSATVAGDNHRVSVNWQYLPRDVHAGNIIFLDDGAIQLEVIATTTTEVRCRIIVGGVLTEHKGVNVPGVRLSMPSITNGEPALLDFGLQQRVDFIALSFVRESAEVRQIKQLLRDRGSAVPLIVKVEKHEAVADIDAIIAAADGVMVARGDLGVEIPLPQVPVVQKDIIHKCNRAGKPVIVATQMLESMITSIRPTRAEVSDVANAIFDGADAVMLSGETAIGRFPVATVKMMADIALEAEKTLPYARILQEKAEQVVAQTDDAISYSACSIAQQLDAAAIIAYTSSGSTALRVSKYRPRAPILAITDNPEVARRLVLSWGVIPYVSAHLSHIDDVFQEASQIALKMDVAEAGQLLVITAGIPQGTPGRTNMIRVQRAG